MKDKYETLDEYLDDLDKIKERIADEIKGMNPKQVAAYFARARERLEKLTGKKLRVGKAGRTKRSANA